MRVKYYIGGGILIIVVAYLLFLSFGDSVSYYLTVSEYNGRAAELADTTVRVSGKIVEGSVGWNADDVELSFTVTEGDTDLDVLYGGARPAGFKEGSAILVEGKYHPDGVFRASQLILKCPSKYEPAE